MNKVVGVNSSGRGSQIGVGRWDAGQGVGHL